MLGNNETIEDTFDILQITSDYWKISFVVFFSVASVFGTVSNCLMVFTFTKFCRGDQRKRYLLGLAVAALTISILYYPLFVAELIFPNITMHRQICTFTKCVKLFVMVHYNLSTTVVSFWNFVFFKYPLKGRIWIKTSRIVFVWTSAFVAAVTIVIFGYFINFRREPGDEHSPCWDLENEMKRLFYQIVFGAVVAPCTFASAYFIASVHLLIYKVRRKRCLVRDKSVPSNDGRRRHFGNGQKRSCWMLVVFISIWLPWDAMVIVRLVCKSCIKQIVLLTVGDTSFFLATFAPFCFFLCTQKYRENLWFALTCGKERPAADSRMSDKTSSKCYSLD